MSAFERSQPMLGSPRFWNSGYTPRDDSTSPRGMRAQSAGAFRPTLKSAATDGCATLIREAVYLNHAWRI